MTISNSRCCLNHSNTFKSALGLPFKPSESSLLSDHYNVKTNQQKGKYKKAGLRLSSSALLSTSFNRDLNHLNLSSTYI